MPPCQPFSSVGADSIDGDSSDWLAGAAASGVTVPARTSLTIPQIGSPGSGTLARSAAELGAASAIMALMLAWRPRSNAAALSRGVMLRERFAEVEQGAFQRLAQHRVGLAFAERKSDLLDALACGETAGRGRAARRDHHLDLSDRRRELGKIGGERVGHRRNRTAAQRRFGTRQRNPPADPCPLHDCV